MDTRKASKTRARPGPPGAAGAQAEGSKARAAQGTVLTSLADHPRLFRATEGFVRDNSNFESSLAVTAALDDVGRCADFQTLFAVPLRHKLFAMDTALRWALFLSAAPDRAAEEGDEPFSPAIAFSSEEALGVVASVYDVGLQEVVWDHFEDDGDDEDDDDDDEDEDGGEGEGGEEGAGAGAADGDA